MEKMLGKVGVVESIDKDGDVRIKMDDGSGSMLWNGSLVVAGALTSSTPASSVKVVSGTVAVHVYRT